MRIRTFGYCKEPENDRQCGTLEKIKNFWGPGKKALPLCGYVTREEHDPEKFMVVLCYQAAGGGREDLLREFMNIVQDCLLSYVVSFSADFSGRLSEIAGKWRNLAGSSIAPSFLAVVGTMEELLLVQYGAGKILYEEKGRLNEWKFSLGDGIPGNGGATEGLMGERGKLCYFRTAYVPDALFLLFPGSVGQAGENIRQLAEQAESGNFVRETRRPERVAAQYSWNCGCGAGIAGYRIEKPLGKTPGKLQRTPDLRKEGPVRPTKDDNLFRGDLPSEKWKIEKQQQTYQQKQQQKQQQKWQLEELERYRGQLQQLTEEVDRLHVQRQNILRQLDMLEQDHQNVQEQIKKREQYVDLKAGKTEKTDPA